MELLVTLLASISGALIGTSVGIYVLYRKLRPITGAELDLTRGKLRSTEFSLSSSIANMEKLRKEVGERDQQLVAAEEKVRTAEIAAAGLRQQLDEHESKAQDASRAVAETANRQIATLESQVDVLNGQVARITAEFDQLKRDFDQESTARSSLETQLSAAHENSRSLASRAAELEAERSHFDLTLQEERQSAAKGLELLVMAQENLTRVFRGAPPEAAGENGKTNGHVAATAVI
jgi:chromosome segregation ATPase